MLTCSIITSLDNIILFHNHVYYTIRLDIVSYHLVALSGMIVTLLDFSVSFFFFLLIGYLYLFLPHGLINEYIISIFMF